jgi:energy-coupling factor transport system ATP-binding protein
LKIEIQNLSFTYRPFGAPPYTALQHIDLTINSGEFMVLAGASGSGKTTLCLQFTGLLEPDSGRVLVDGEDIRKSRQSLRDVRRKIGTVLQFPESQLFAETVYDDVAYAPRNFGVDEDAVQHRVAAALQSVALPLAKYRNRSPFSLSAGEQRRVAIAGILAMQPQVLILDEPTAGLDAAGRRALMQTIEQLHQTGRTVVMVSHDLELAAALAARFVVLRKGQIVLDGSKSEIFHDQALLSACGLVHPRSLKFAERLHELGLVKTGALYSVADIKAALDQNIE